MNAEQARRRFDRYAGQHRMLTFDRLDLHSLRVGRHSRVDHCTFDAADLRLATIHDVSFLSCSFRGARLRGASLRGVSFSGCDLRNADLRDVDLTGARFSYVNSGRDDVGRTALTGADLAGATVDDVVLERVVGWPAHLVR